MNEGRRESAAFKLGIYAVLILGGLPILLPLYWLGLASLKTRERMNVSPPDWIPIDARNYVTIDGQELAVSVFDDGKLSGTGVARVKLVRDDDATLRIARERITREIVDEYETEIDDVQRRVRPLSPPPFDSGEIEVELIGEPRQIDVPLASVAISQKPRFYWMVLGAEARVRCEADWPPDGGMVRIFDVQSPEIAVAPHLVSGEQPARVRWRSRNLPGRIVRTNEPGGYHIIRLELPDEGLVIPSDELRREIAIRRTATLGDPPTARPVKVLSRDEAARTARVELLDENRRVRIPADALTHRPRVTYWMQILGERMEIQPAMRKGRGSEQQPLPHGRGSEQRTDRGSEQRTDRGAGGRVPVHITGAISVAAERIRAKAPLSPQWSNYAAAWREQDFDLYLVNTAFIAALVVLGTVLSCGLVGYAFARLEFRGRDGLFLLLLATMMIPAQVTSIPTFVLFVRLGWMDSYLPLIVPHFLAHSAFFVFLFRQFMLTIPTDLEDSARIDGCGPLRTWWLIMMPLSKPIIVTVAVFAFVGVWNDFLYPLLYINSDEKQTVALGLHSFKSAYRGADPQLIMAASVMMIIPSIVLFFVAQKAFMRGVVVSGVKG